MSERLQAPDRGEPPEAAPDPDLEFWERVQRGDWDALAQLVMRYSGRLYGCVRKLGVPREDAEDLVHEALVLFLTKWVGTAAPPHEGKKRLYRNVYNVVRNWRRERRIKTLDNDQLADCAEVVNPPVDELCRKEEIERLRAALQNLPELERQAVLHLEVEDLTLDMAAKARGVTFSQVRTLHGKGMTRLRRALKG